MEKGYINKQHMRNSDSLTGDGTFISSVEAFSSADIKARPEEERIKTIIPLLIRSAMMAVALGVFCYSFFVIASRMIEDKRMQDAYAAIRPNIDAVSEVNRPNQLREPSRMLTLLEMLDFDGEIPDYIVDPVDYNDIMWYKNTVQNLSAQYPDVYGWIIFTGTKAPGVGTDGRGIDYPIMQGEDNFYYLEHDYRGREARAGSIFADFSLSRNHEENYNTLIYGHNMGNGSMFRAIKLWYEKPNRNTLAESMQIEIYTKDAVYVYELFSAYRSDDFNFDKTQFKDSEDYLAYLREVEKRSVLGKKVPYSAQSKICTLVTCTNVAANKNERFVVHGIQRQVIPYE